MSYIVGNAQVAGSSVFEDVAEVPGMLGSKVQDSQGRTLRLVKAGGTNIAAGAMLEAPATKTNHHGLAVNTAALNDKTVTVTLGATAATANEYSGGFLNVVDDTGEGYSLEIESHPAADASASLVVTLKDPIKVAFSADTTVDLVHNKYNGVIAAATATSTPVGVAVRTITASQYGWVVVDGYVATKAEATLTLGAMLKMGTAGGVDELDDFTDPSLQQFVGYARPMAGVSGEHPLVDIKIG